MMTFEEWRDKKGFPITSTQQPLWRECWEAAQIALRSERDAARAALLELVALKDLKDEESRMRQRRECTRLRGSVDMRLKVDAMRDAYNLRKPAAWVAARAVLSAITVPSETRACDYTGGTCTRRGCAGGCQGMMLIEGGAS